MRFEEMMNCRKVSKVFYCFNHAVLRRKHKDTHWSVIAKKNATTDKALLHFDDLYKGFYGMQWPSIRAAILSPSKYCAVVNNFGDSEETISNLKNLGAVNIRSVFEAETHLRSLDGNRMKNLPQNRPQWKLKALSNSEKVSECSKGIDMLQDITKDAGSAEEIPEDLDGDEPSPASLRLQLSNPNIEHDRMMKPGLSGDDISAAALHEFVPATKLKGMEDWVLESEHYEGYKGSESFPIRKTEEKSLTYPEQWQIFSYIRGNISRFPSPRRGKAGVYNYYLMDAASILPVLALDLTIGDRVLDMCAGPGGKSLLILQTLCPDVVVSNDIQTSRVERIKGVFDDYLLNTKSWRNNVNITRRDARGISDQNIYNKILVDVPCTTDRHSVMENDNNIFNPSRVKERIRLPQLQSQLLSNALKIVRPGGTVIYSTCSLSPVQNDGVVHMALKSIWEETQVEVEVRDMTPALQATKNVFKFAASRQLRYGHVVLPFLPNNFGPTYFCKLVKKK